MRKLIQGRRGRGGVGVGAEEEEECIWDNMVVFRGEINAVVTTDGSKVASINP